MKQRLTQELLERAERVFKANPQILTGQGLSRDELKLLRKRGLVERVDLMQHKKTGQIAYAWRRTS